MIDPQTRLNIWLRLDSARVGRGHFMIRIARPLERRAAELDGGGYAKLVGQDADGRVRFTVRGLGQRTFSLEELAG